MKKEMSLRGKYPDERGLKKTDPSRREERKGGRQFKEREKNGGKGEKRKLGILDVSIIRTRWLGGGVVRGPLKLLHWIKNMMAR